MTWSHDIHKQLQKYEVGIVSYIPDGGLTQLIQLCEQDSSINDGMLVAVLKVDAEEMPRVLPPIDGAFLTHRFRAALLGEHNALRA